jgi:thioredoxin 2
VRIVCPHCQSVNRVPGTRVSNGSSAQCHRPLFIGQPIALTVADYDVHATRNDIPGVWTSGRRGVGPAG